MSRLTSHPIRHARAKTYEYRILRDEVCPPFERHFVHHYPYPLNTDRMEEIVPLLQGAHNFTAFAAADKSDAQGLSKVRTIFSSSLEHDRDRIIYRVRGSGFLKHMVRNIVGTLLEAGKGNVDAAALHQLLSGGSVQAPDQRYHRAAFPFERRILRKPRDTNSQAVGFQLVIAPLVRYRARLRNPTVRMRTLTRGRRLSRCVVVPAQNSESAQCVPTAGAAGTGLHLQRNTLGMKEVERPATVLMLALDHDFDGLTDAAVRFDSRL